MADLIRVTQSGSEVEYVDPRRLQAVQSGVDVEYVDPRLFQAVQVGLIVEYAPASSTARSFGVIIG